MLFSKDQNFLNESDTSEIWFKFKPIYFTSIEKQVLTTYTNLSRFCFLGTTPVLARNVWANEKSQSCEPLLELELGTS